MFHAVRISGDLFSDAARYAKVENRSVPKQIEYWSRVGKIASENPDLNFTFIKEILLSLEDVKSENVSKYVLE